MRGGLLYLEVNTKTQAKKCTLATICIQDMCVVSDTKYSEKTVHVTNCTVWWHSVGNIQGTFYHNYWLMHRLQEGINTQII